jgi:hypothetical protein
MIDAIADMSLTLYSDLESHERFIFFILLTIATLASLFYLFIFIRHGRIILDTPTSKVRSASQGFVELAGNARSLDDTPLKSRGSFTQCVWYDVLVEKPDGNKWVTVEQDTSIYSFYIDDGTGLCAVDPEIGEVRTKAKKVWKKGKLRYTERLIKEGEVILCLGQFESEQGRSKTEIAKVGTRLLLTQWKQDRDNLLRRFDANGDGEIDMNEWNQARQAAQQQAMKEIDDDYEPSSHNCLVKPFDRGHPYLITTFTQEELTKRFKLNAFGLFAAFLASGTCLTLIIVIYLNSPH